MALDLTLINAALTRTGNDPITELSDGSPGGDIAGMNYNLLVAHHLTAYPWTWATKTKLLVAIVGDVDPPWLYAYQLPGDVKRLRVVTVESLPIDYEQQSDKLLCDYDNTASVIAKYTYTVAEAYWPADFGEAITQFLEAMFLRGIGERYDQAEAREKTAARTMQAAKTSDAMKKSPRNAFTSPTLAARNGGVTASTASLPFARG